MVYNDFKFCGMVDHNATFVAFFGGF